MPYQSASMLQNHGGITTYTSHAGAIGNGLGKDEGAIMVGKAGQPFPATPAPKQNLPHCWWGWDPCAAFMLSWDMNKEGLATVHSSSCVFALFS